jgi:hypothetical protein
MKSTLTGLGHELLTLDKCLNHLANLLKSAQNNLIALNKAIALVLDGSLVAEFADQSLQSTQVVTRYTREEMVDSLELEASVQEIQPSGAIDIHGGAQLTLREALGRAQIGGGHAPMAQGDLNVQKHGDAVRDEDECNSNGPCGECAPEKSVAKYSPVASHEENLDGTSPPSRAEVGSARRHQMEPGQKVQIETGDGHDGVVGVLLVGYNEVGGGIPDEGKVVEGTQDRAEVSRRSREKRNVLKVGIVFGHVGDEMVNVVRALPPTNAEATAEVGNESTDKGVEDEVASDATVTGVVSSEHDLLPEHTQEAGRCEIPLSAEEVDEGSEEDRVSDELLAILDVRAVVEAFVLDAFVQGTEVDGNGQLCLLINRWHASKTLGNLLLFHGRGEGHAGSMFSPQGICLVQDGFGLSLIKDHVSLGLFIVGGIVMLTDGGAADWRLQIGPGFCYPADPVCSHTLEGMRGVVPESCQQLNLIKPFIQPIAINCCNPNLGMHHQGAYFDVLVVILGWDPETLTPENATALTIDKNVYRNCCH